MSSVPFTGDGFLALARRLMELKPCEEAERRSAIGRTYYACFLRVRWFLDGQQQQVDQGRLTHRDVQAKIAAFDPKMAEHLRRLHQLRKNADYSYVHRANMDAATTSAFDLAGRILTRLAKLEQQYPSHRRR